MKSRAFMQGVSSGDESAITDLYQAFYKDVYRLAYMMTKNVAVSQDITHDVFLSVLTQSQSYPQIKNIKAWLLALTRNKVLDTFRYNSYTKQVDDDYFARLPEPENNLLEFLDTLKILEPLDQQIVIFRIHYKLRHKEIAQILSLPESSIRKKYQRALTFLKSQYLKGEKYEKNIQ